MNVPPLILDIKVRRPDRRPLRLWLPLFLLWPLAVGFGALALAVAAAVDAVLLAGGRSYHQYTVLLLRSFQVLGATRGTVIRVSNEKSAVDMTVL